MLENPAANLPILQGDIWQVALDVPLDRLFDYRAPTDRRYIEVGARVIVPFGRRRLLGIVLGASDASSFEGSRLRTVEQVLDELPAVPVDALDTARFCASYYHHPLGEVLFAALPGMARRAGPIRPARVLGWRLTPAGAVANPEALSPRARVPQKLLASLQAQPMQSHRALVALGSGVARHLQGFLERGWVEPLFRLTGTGQDTTPLPTLTDAQAAAVSAVKGFGHRFVACLLHGVTGSGKTEVYLRLTAEALARQEQVLLLVPEINLAPQLRRRLEQRFPDTIVAELHSGLSERARLDHWQTAARGEAGIVLGTRLAVFSPLPRLGLIIVDEEHETAYKQQEGLRYHARDVAVARAKRSGVPIVLGSATPTLETWQNAHNGRYHLLELPERAHAAARLPDVRLIDLRRHSAGENGLAPPALQALEQAQQHQIQSLVFINRRGFAPVLWCKQCGWAAPCPRCSVRLTLHQRRRALSCHHCGYESPITPACPDCGNLDLNAMGQGTQRIEAALTEHFPTARILRVDSDSGSGAGAGAALLESVHHGEIDVLVGTQMLAKGHDFSRLGLVVVINADAALYSPDFRAAERLFAQLMQVGGRAGRSAAAGQVLVQTAFPGHPLMQALLRHDYAGYVAGQLAERKAAAFPPYSHQAMLRAEAVSQARAQAFLAEARRWARQFSLEGESVDVFDPVPAPVARVAHVERAQLLLQSASRRSLHHLLEALMPMLRKQAPAGVRWVLDVDPL